MPEVYVPCSPPGFSHHNNRAVISVYVFGLVCTQDRSYLEYMNETWPQTPMSAPMHYASITDIYHDGIGNFYVKAITPVEYAQRLPASSSNRAAHTYMSPDVIDNGSDGAYAVTRRSLPVTPVKLEHVEVAAASPIPSIEDVTEGRVPPNYALNTPDKVLFYTELGSWDRQRKRQHLENLAILTDKLLWANTDAAQPLKRCTHDLVVWNPTYLVSDELLDHHYSQPYRRVPATAARPIAGYHSAYPRVRCVSLPAIDYNLYMTNVATNHAGVTTRKQWMLSVRGLVNPRNPVQSNIDLESNLDARLRRLLPSLVTVQNYRYSGDIAYSVTGVSSAYNFNTKKVTNVRETTSNSMQVDDISRYIRRMVLSKLKAGFTFTLPDAIAQLKVDVKEATKPSTTRTLLKGLSLGRTVLRD